MAISANKGEWSELYALLKILGDGTIFSGNWKLEKQEKFYPVLKAIRDELSRQMEYVREREIVLVLEDGGEVARVPVKEFLENSQLLFKQINCGHGAFEIPEMTDFLSKIKCQKIKAKSSDKSDIRLVIHDNHTGMSSEFGFSVKSFAGSAPTLLNASDATKMQFSIDGENLSNNFEETINTIDGNAKLQKRIETICGNAKIKFERFLNKTFNNNLQMVDRDLPEILAKLLIDGYLQKDTSIANTVERLRKKNPLNFDLSENHDFYGYKIKTFLSAIALGMLPATPWSGRFEATGGYIVVKEDGEIVCFHIFDKNLLEDYLFYNTRFETPSLSRYNCGKVFQDADGKLKINLALQIRF